MPAPMARTFEMLTPLAFAALLLVGEIVPLSAAELLAVSEPASLLAALSEDLSEIDIVTAENLNDRQLVRQRITVSRLGGFADLPSGALPDSNEILSWEREYDGGQIGGLIVLSGASSATLSTPLNKEELQSAWLQSAAEQRAFITFFSEQHEQALRIAELARAHGNTSQLFFQTAEAENAGWFYATAGLRLALDSRAARRYRSEVTEINYLGERLRRNSNSVFKGGSRALERSLTRYEPAVFLKESLGDEYTRSTINEIIVPGGVALGETAAISLPVFAMEFSGKALLLRGANEQLIELPEIELSTQKALFDYVERSQSLASDAIVDIDGESRVKISSALRDTGVGYLLLHADTQPFEFVRNLNVTKSVIIDTDVQWFLPESNTAMAFTTEFEVRFLSADNMRIAQTRLALVYDYTSSEASPSYSRAWGRDAGRLSDNVDLPGLGESVAEVARIAGWVALLRKLHEENTPFLQGRYEFMKVDKGGRATPSRY